MMDYESIIKKLEDESNRVDCSEAQREANAFRIRYIRMMNRPIPAETDYKRLDPVQERLANDQYRLTPDKLLKD